jgi:V/A-type H+-transporting ATPase subunit D
MAIKFQYNKTELQRLNKELKVRQHALPILKNKEAALRVEVKKARREAEAIQSKLEKSLEAQAEMAGLWVEFNFDLLKIKAVHSTIRKIAGVSIPVLEEIEFDRQDFSLFNRPAWFPDGIHRLEKWATLALERVFLLQKMNLLDHARKKTTQKVNLYEKVQIPGYEEAIKRIKRFLEDQENLAKAAQKIIKNRQEAKRNAS